MSGVPDADTLTRQPRQPSLGTIDIIEPERITPEEALAEAKAELARETARADANDRSAQEAQRIRHAAEARLQQADQAILSSQERTIASSIHAATTTIERAKSDLVAAINSGDPVAQADAQGRLSMASAELTTLSGQKAYFENERARAVEEAKRAPPPDQVGKISVNTPGGTLAVGASDKDWMDKHPKFYSDPTYYNHAIAAHTTVVNDGAQPGTPAYYRALDAEMSEFDRYEAFKRGEPVNDQNNLSQRQQQRRQPASSFGAPVSRASAPRNDSRAPSADQVARQIGPGVNESDLRDAAKWAGYERGKFYNGKRFDSDESAFQQYLSDQSEIASIDRMGGETGLKRDQNFRWE